MNNSEPSIFDIWNTRLTVIIPSITALTFLIGAFWADLYFKQFHIDFFKVSGFSGAFHFLFSNIKIVAMSIFISIGIYLIYGAAVFFIIKSLEKLLNYFLSDSSDNDSEDEALTHLQKWIISLAFTGAIIYGGTSLIIELTENIASKIKFNVNAQRYEAITVFYANPMPMELKCVYSLGSIGNYNAYLSKHSESTSPETHLIKESAISSIRYPLSFLKTTSKKTRKEAIKENWSMLCGK